MSTATPQPLSNTFWLAIAAGLVVAWLLFLRFFGPEQATGDLEPPQLILETGSRMAEYDWPLQDLEGKPTSLSAFKGKAILLNIWATYCPPCVAEMPSISNVASNPKLKDMAVVCVSTDADPAVLRGWLAGRDLGMTILRADSMPEVFATQMIPVTFLISPAGKIVGKVEGGAQWDHPKSVDALLALTEMKAD
ncbi:TlpA disulfide reductase family protein [Isosphaeraceae bacterium EP7]